MHTEQLREIWSTELARSRSATQIGRGAGTPDCGLVRNAGDSIRTAVHARPCRERLGRGNTANTYRPSHVSL